MRVEVVLTEADITQEFTEAMEARDLPEKFFCWFPRSAAEWVTLASDTELHGGLWQTWTQIAAEAPLLGEIFHAKVPVISFGAGDGARDRLLMDALKKTGAECSYYPVDASQSMLELASAGAEDEDIETVGIKADISSPMHLVYAADAADPPRLFVFSGNTMGSFDPLAEIRSVAQCLKPGDRLLVDGEVFHPELTLARRDNRAVRRFVSALLAGVGISEPDGEIRFNLKNDSRHPGLHLVTRHFRAGRDISATVASQEISLERGERIGLNFQYAYTAEAFRWLLSEQGGLEIVRQYPSSDGRFLTALCRK